MISPKIAIGTGRTVLIKSGLAFKFARSEKGSQDNLLEAKGWEFAKEHPLHRITLCPVLWCSKNGAVSIMPSVKSTTHDEFEENVKSIDAMFDYHPHDIGTAFHYEWKADSWGWLDGRLVCVDYQHDGHSNFS